MDKERGKVNWDGRADLGGASRWWQSCSSRECSWQSRTCGADPPCPRCPRTSGKRPSASEGSPRSPESSPASLASWEPRGRSRLSSKRTENFGYGEEISTFSSISTAKKREELMLTSSISSRRPISAGGSSRVPRLKVVSVEDIMSLSSEYRSSSLSSTTSCVVSTDGSFPCTLKKKKKRKKNHIFQSHGKEIHSLAKFCQQISHPYIIILKIHSLWKNIFWGESRKNRLTNCFTHFITLLHPYKIKKKICLSHGKAFWAMTPLTVDQNSPKWLNA